MSRRHRVPTSMAVTYSNLRRFSKKIHRRKKNHVWNKTCEAFLTTR